MCGSPPHGRHTISAVGEESPEAAMSGYRPRGEGELYGLPPERLLDHYLQVRKARRVADAKLALGILAWQFSDRIEFWVGRRLHRDERQDLEVIVGEVYLTVARSALKFEGVDVPAFGAWLRQIATRRAYDYLRARMRASEERPLVEEHEGEEEIWGETPSIPDPTALVIARSVVDQALGELSAVHRRVVELAGPREMGFANAPAQEAAGRINDQFRDDLNDPMTNGNVHKICSRFRRRVEQLASDADAEASRG
jgi:DNA-directed RNA polymerase specialized sigma24 family protein